MAELKEILKERGYIRGPFGSALRRGEMKETGIPVYEQQQAIYETRDFRYYIDNEKFKELKRFQVQENDIIISCSGTVGRSSIIKKEDPKGIISQALLILRPDENKIDPLYLLYFLRSPIGYRSLINASYGSVQPNIAKRSIVESIDINLPAKADQKSIANILSSLDDKIELNRRMNQTLEKMAKAIYKQWFEDFEFPNEEGKPYKSSGGEFVGELPKGWSRKKIGELYETTSGGTPSRTNLEYYTNGTVQWVKSKELNGSFVIKTEEKITDLAIKKSSAKLLPEKTVLIAMYGATVGEIGILNTRAACNQAICAIIPNEKFPFSYIYFYLSYYKKHFQNLAVGSAQQNISQIVIKSELIKVPNNQLLQKFHDIIFPLLEQIKLNHISIQSLINTRDILLPKLISGQLPINHE